MACLDDHDLRRVKPLHSLADDGWVGHPED
jgi:hypothetical protein